MEVSMKMDATKSAKMPTNLRLDLLTRLTDLDSSSLAVIWISMVASKTGQQAKSWVSGYLSRPSCIHFHRNFHPGSHGRVFKGSNTPISESQNSKK